MKLFCKKNKNAVLSATRGESEKVMENITKYEIRIEKIENGVYRLVESWRDKVYGDIENTLSRIYRINSHKWSYTYFGYTYHAKALWEVKYHLHRFYDFK